MVASLSFVAFATTVFALTADAAGFYAEADLAGANGLKPREVTVTVTYCSADASTPAVPPVYTTANLPPMESAPTTTPVSYTTSVVPPGGETGGTGGTGGSTPVPSSYTPVVPVPVTSTPYGTTEPANPPPSTSVYTATPDTGTGTGTGTVTVSSSVTTHVTTAATTHPATGTSATGTPSTTSTVGAGNVISANLGLMVLVAMAALA